MTCQAEWATPTELLRRYMQNGGDDMTRRDSHQQRGRERDLERKRWERKRQQQAKTRRLTNIPRKTKTDSTSVASPETIAAVLRL
jgi:hypothetical protein